MLNDFTNTTAAYYYYCTVSHGKGETPGPPVNTCIHDEIRTAYCSYCLLSHIWTILLRLILSSIAVRYLRAAWKTACDSQVAILPL